jgi:L-aspartate semialdehyde sulfurtransferase ferredoxin
VDVGAVGENHGVRRRFHVTFPEALVDEPVVYTLGRRFDVVTNIRRASLEDRSGWMILELEGDEAAVGEAVSWLLEQGVEVSRLDEEG